MKKVALFCGGFSSEFEISLKSADTILKNFPEHLEVFKVIVTKNEWKAEYNGKSYNFDKGTSTFNTDNGLVKPDFAIIYIHGEPGENGKIQALLDMQNIPYANSSVLASALSFDKWFCNQFLKQFEIPVAKSILLTNQENVNFGNIAMELGLPVFVKPSDSGSSFGISKAKTIDELKESIKKAFQEGKSVVVESFLDGTEVTCGVYRRQNGVHALPLTEIASENEFFDYDAKYLGKSQEITPARIADNIRDLVQNQAKKIYQILQLRSISRIDFMIVNDIPHLIEVNTTPGFSPASIVPQMIAADGLSLKEFWTEILEVEMNVDK